MPGARISSRLIVSALSLGLLSACGSSPQTRFFTLDPVAPSELATAIPAPPIRVDRVTIPSVMDRPEMVREYAEDQLKVDDFNHWGAPLGELMRATLVENLTARLPSGRVLPSEQPTPEGAADLTVEIADIHEGAGGLVLDVDWTISQRRAAPASPGQILRKSRHERIKTPMPGSSQQAFAAALSQAMGLLADRIVKALAPAA